MLSLFLGMFGQGDVSEILAAGDGLGIVLYYVYLLTVPLILFNILVAMITDAYVEVDSDKDAIWRLNRSKLIVELEESMPHYVKERFQPEAIEVVLEPFEQQREATDQEKKAELTKALDTVTEKVDDQQRLLSESLEGLETLDKKCEDAAQKYLSRRQEVRRKLAAKKALKQKMVEE